MPTYDFACPRCEHQLETFMRLAEYETFNRLCSVCGAELEQLLTKPPAVDSFKPFTTSHLKALVGGDVTVSSLQQIRKLEKQFEDRKLCWEPGSYDNSRYGEE